MDFRDFVTAHFSCKLDPKVYHTCEDKVEFHFHPPFPLSPNKRPIYPVNKKIHPIISRHPSPLNISPTLACIEMNSTFDDVLKLKKAIECKMYFDQHCYVTCFETPSLVRL